MELPSCPPKVQVMILTSFARNLFLASIQWAWTSVGRLRCPVLREGDLGRWDLRSPYLIGDGVGRSLVCATFPFLSSKVH